MPGWSERLRGWWRSFRHTGGAAPVRAVEGVPATPGVHLRHRLRTLTLQFSDDQAQSRMLRWAPDRLLVDYTRTMMGFLLYDPSPARVLMIGLGGGSQAKFCHRHLPATRVEVVEINPEVIALRRTFRIPADDTRLQVHLGDGAEFVRRERGAWNVLLVDGYDRHGIAEALSSQRFYDDCRAALAPGGVMVVNLFGSAAGAHLDRIRRAFGKRAVRVVEEPQMSNKVVFAWNAKRPPPPHPEAERGPALRTTTGRRQLLPVFDRLQHLDAIEIALTKR